MNTRPLLLCLSKNPELLEIRLRVLSMRYDVVPVRSLDEMKALSSNTPFDVLVLCHSLSQMEFDEATELARATWPGIRIVAIATALSPHSDRVPAVVDALAGPPSLFRSISSLLGGQMGSHL
jgi:CheY-like chemotaxis protein